MYIQLLFLKKLFIMKYVLRVMGKEAKVACGTDQLSGGVEVGI